MSYDNYPASVRNNARRGIELNRRQNNKCATQTGKVRASQLAQGKPISLETVQRMYSYLSRAAEYYDPNDREACGTISYLLWGGKAGLRWATKILRQEGKLDAAQVDAVVIDGRMAYRDKNEALEIAESIGCEGAHVHVVNNTVYWMPCKTHDNFADVGPRGGIRKSPKAPKSDTPNPNPKRGGKGDASTSRGAVVPKEVEPILQKKSDEFNERYKEKLGYGVTVAKLRAVYKRGVGAFQTSHSPAVKSERQWALARVNAFLYLVKNGRPQNKKYTSDYDLLPKGHPKADK